MYALEALRNGNWETVEVYSSPERAYAAGRYLSQRPRYREGTEELRVLVESPTGITQRIWKGGRRIN